MQKIYAFLKLFRAGNLLMAGILLYLLRYALFTPFYTLLDATPQMSDLQFAIFTLSTLVIMGAGYLINDYFDTTIDQINHPNRIYVGKIISPDMANILFYVLSLFGVATGFILGKSVGFVNLGSVYLVVALVLYFYSLKYKRILFFGNFVIAILSGFLIVHLWLFEFFALRQNADIFFEAMHQKWFSHVNKVVFFYAGFAFILTLMREIVKDLEDQKGDAADGCDTLAIAFGIRKTKILLWLLGIALIGAIAVFQYTCYTPTSIYYIFSLLIAVQLPLFYFLFKLQKAQSQTEYHFIASGLKIITGFGILTLLGVYTLLP